MPDNSMPPFVASEDKTVEWVSHRVVPPVTMPAGATSYMPRPDVFVVTTDQEVSVFTLDDAGEFRLRGKVATQPPRPPSTPGNPARPGDCKYLCGMPGCAMWGCLR
jgi:hypothetical protein